MKKLVLMIVVITFIVSLGFSQQSSDIPEKVKISLDALLKTRTANQVFGMEYVNSYFYVTQGAVYVNVLFKADLEKDWKDLKKAKDTEHEKTMAEYNEFVAKEKAKVEEANKVIREKNKSLQAAKRTPEKPWEAPPVPEAKHPKAYHNLYMRLVKEGNVVQQYKAPMPFDEEATEYYSFGLIIEPGKYDLLLNVNRFDDTRDGTLLVELDVPNMTLTDLVTPAKKILNGPPVFYKKINTLHVVENRFNVVKNCYRVDPFKQEFYPYIEKEYAFKAGDAPTMAFFILGVPQPWNVKVEMEIKKGKKKVVGFKVADMKNPYFFQPLQFKDKDKKSLEPGEYSLSIKLIDGNQKSRKGEIDVPFKIVE